MNSAFFWIDFATEPLNILMSGASLGVLVYFFTAGLMWSFNVKRNTGKWIIIAAAVLAVVLAQAVCWGINIWYNTPLGPPLDLK